MINAIKDNWWNKVNDPPPPPPPPPEEPVLAWRGIDKICLQNAGENTGESMYDNLEQYNVDTLASTGVVKDNVIGDPDYIAPVQDEATCPITVYAWEGYQPYCITEEIIEPEPEPTPEINNTRIKILFDNSGSMSDLENTLNHMKANSLKQRLEGYYDSPELYDQLVSVENMERPEDTANNIYHLERTFAEMSLDTEEDVIYIVFQDEAEDVYYFGTALSDSEVPDQGPYKTDINNLNAKLDLNTGKFNAMIFQIYGYLHFKVFLQRVMTGLNGYAGNMGLAGRNNIEVRYDVPRYPNTNDSTKYTDLIINTLGYLGYNI